MKTHKNSLGGLVTVFFVLALTLLISLTLFVSQGFTAIPQQISYQGYLTNASGVPINGTVTMTFRIYDASSGGNSLWTETQNNILVTQGVYSIILGSQTPINLPFDVPYYLEIEIGGEILSPRKTVTSVGYAFRALTVETIGIHTHSGAEITSGTISEPRIDSGIARTSSLNAHTSNTDNPHSTTATQVGAVALNQSNSINSDMIQDGAVTNAKITGPISSNKISSIGLDADTLDGIDSTEFALATHNHGTEYVTEGQTDSISEGMIQAGAVTDVKITGPISTTKLNVGTGAGTVAAGDHTHAINTWHEVTGTSQQAAPNGRYMANNASEVTITLPVSPSLGDVVRVSGIGAGGWRIAQNDGQVISIGSLMGQIWTPQESNRGWRGLASSSDGSKLLACAYGGQIYTSTDSGLNWTPRESSRSWQGAASSSDGTNLVAVAEYSQIYISTDSGLNWTPSESSRNWRDVAISSDGTKLVAVAYGNQIYTSTDSGINWTPRESNRNWAGVACSADGTKLVAVAYGGQIYTSTDSGLNWTPRESNRNWTGVASSSDGTKLVASVQNGQIYTSTDSGLNWTPRESNRAWVNIDSSSDGKKLVAAVYGGQIYTSTDSGLTWTSRESNRNWNDVVISSDGTTLMTVVYGGRIYISNTKTTAGVVGYLTCGQHCAIELQYIGNNTFIPLSHAGDIRVY